MRLNISFKYGLILVAISGLGITDLHASQVYKSVDKNGRIVYSDKPSKGAKLHKLRKTPTIPAAEVKARFSDAPKEQEKLAKPEVKILYPKNQSHILVEQSGKIRIQVSMNQPLLEDFKIALYRNGEKLAQGVDTVFWLTNQDRGEHKYTVKLLDPEGKEVSSDSITLFVQRGRIARPSTP